jgi:hypothetical protein
MGACSIAAVSRKSCPGSAPAIVVRLAIGPAHFAELPLEIPAADDQIAGEADESGVAIFLAGPDLAENVNRQLGSLAGASADDQGQ